MRVLLLILALAGLAHAADQTILGKQLQVKDPKPGVDATKRKVVGQGQEKGSPNTIVGDPTLVGATLTVSVDGTTPSSQTYTLPAPLWTAVKAGFKYKDSKLTMGPVKTAALTLAKGTFQLKANVSGKTGGITVVPPNTGTDGCLLLAIGTKPRARRDGRPLPRPLPGTAGQHGQEERRESVRGEGRDGRGRVSGGVLARCAGVRVGRWG